MPSPLPLYCTVQPGFEDALEGEIQLRFRNASVEEALPGWRVFARSGGGFALEELRGAPSRFARSWGLYLGRQPAPWNRAQGRAWFAEPFLLQAWSRRHSIPGAREKNPVLIDVKLRDQELRQAMPELGLPLKPCPSPEAPGERVINCIRVGPGDWAWGIHLHSLDRIEHAGGDFPWPPHEVPSRAYVKCREALHWSRAPVRPKDTALELGCAPGGAVLALLEQGLEVVGVDPAELLPSVHEAARARGLGLVHHRSIAERFSPESLPERLDWVFSDMNVDPQALLDLLKSWKPALQARGVRGLFLTLKLTERSWYWKLGELEELFRSQWGFERAESRQLSQNRREILLYAGPSR